MIIITACSPDQISSDKENSTAVQSSSPITEVTPSTSNPILSDLEIILDETVIQGAETAQEAADDSSDVAISLEPEQSTPDNNPK